MAEYKGNSHRSKEQQEVVEKKKIEPRAQAKTKKKSEAKKLVGAFVQEDVTSVKDYIINDVLIPAAKKAITDIITNGIEMLLYGETRSKSKSRDTKVSYTKYYDRDRDYDRPSTFSPSDRDRWIDSPALSARGSLPSRRTSG